MKIQSDQPLVTPKKTREEKIHLNIYYIQAGFYIRHSKVLHVDLFLDCKDYKAYNILKPEKHIKTQALVPTISNVCIGSQDSPFMD